MLEDEIVDIALCGGRIAHLIPIPGDRPALTEASELRADTAPLPPSSELVSASAGSDGLSRDPVTEFA